MDGMPAYDAAAPAPQPVPGGGGSGPAVPGGGRPDGPPGASGRVIRAVGAVVFDGAGRLLLIQRGHEPGKGLWSVPGGKVEPGETDEQAAAREIAEETGLLVRVGAPLGAVTRDAGAGRVFEIVDYDAVVIGVAAHPGGGDPDASAAGWARAADDADDLRWVTREELDALPLTEGLIEALTAWDRLPR